MAGISSKALNGLAKNKYKYNGIEQNTDFDLNMYDAFYRNLDPQIGRFWQIDPEAEMLEEYSPYASMYNNPISNTDPLGDFATRFGAWLHKIFHGGGSIQQNGHGEWSVLKVKPIYSDDGNTMFVTQRYYGKGRNQYSAAAEAAARDYRIIADIEVNGDRSMYQMYDSEEEAGKAALSYIGLAVPVALKAGTNAVNAGKNISKIESEVVQTATSIKKGVLQKLSQHAFAKGRHNDIGLPVDEMAAKAYNVVRENLALLKPGDNTLVATINGVAKSFKAYVKNGVVESINMYPGISNRVSQGTNINLGNLKW